MIDFRDISFLCETTGHLLCAKTTKHDNFEHDVTELFCKRCGACVVITEPTMNTKRKPA